MLGITTAQNISSQLSDINFDNLSSTTSSGFNFGGLVGGLTGGGLSFDDPVGSLTNIGVTALTDNVPFLSTFLGVMNIDISENISNVTTYGLNSWGATTNPENIKTYLKQYEQDIQNYINNFNQDLEYNVNELSRFLHWGHDFYARMRRDHASANSTKEAYDLAINFFLSQLENVFYPIIKKFQKAGVCTSSSTKIPVLANDFLHLGQPVNQNDPPIHYWRYSFDMDKIKEIEKSTTNNTDNVTQNQSSNTDNDSSKKSSTSLLTFISAILLLKQL